MNRQNLYKKYREMSIIQYFYQKHLSLKLNLEIQREVKKIDFVYWLQLEYQNFLWCFDNLLRKQGKIGCKQTRVIGQPKDQIVRK